MSIDGWGISTLRVLIGGVARAYAVLAVLRTAECSVLGKDVVLDGIGQGASSLVERSLYRHTRIDVTVSRRPVDEIEPPLNARAARVACPTLTGFVVLK